MNNGEPIGVNGEQRGATGGVNGEATVSNGWQWGSISHLRGAMLKDVRLNRRDVRVDLVGRGKLANRRGCVRVVVPAMFEFAMLAHWPVLTLDKVDPLSRHETPGLQLLLQVHHGL